MTKSGSTGSAKKGKKKPVTKDVELSIGEPTSRRSIHPAMHFDHQAGRAYFGFFLPVTTKIASEDKNSQADTPCLVSDKGETIPCVEQELKRLDITLAAEPEWGNVTDNPISNTLLTAIMNHDKKTIKSRVDEIARAFMATVKNNREIIYLKDKRWYEYLGLWTFGTYVFILFSCYPQVLLWGPRGSAKTKIMTVVRYLAFNAELSPSLSPSSLFRTVESRRATLLLDEMEKIGNKDISYDLRSLLLSGYKKDGVVKRTEPDGTGKFRQRRYQVYSPKMIANIEGIDQTLQDRCITINTQRLSGDRLPKHLKAIVNRSVTTSKRMLLYQRLRDSFYIGAYSHWQAIASIIKQDEEDDEDEEDVTARHLELWYPILVLARFFESFSDIEPALEGLEQRMRDLLAQVIEEYRLTESDSNEHTLIKALWNMTNNLKDDERIVASYKEVRQEWTRVIEGIEDEDAEFLILSWMKGRYTGKMLRKLGFKKGDLARHGRGWMVRLTKKKVSQLVEFYDVETSDVPLDTSEGPLDTRSPRAPSAQRSPEDDESGEHNEHSERGEHTERRQENSKESPDSALNDEVILMVLQDLKRAVTWETLKKAVVKLGYSREEFDTVFKGMQDHPDIIKSKSGKSLILYKFKESGS